MNKIKWFIAIIGSCILAYFILIEKYPPTKKAQGSSTNDSINVVVKKRFDKFDKLKSDVEIVNGVKHGVAHNYYDNGTIHSTIHYKNGLKHGLSCWFYENGKTYRETPFVLGKKHGWVKKFYSNGKLMSEVPFENNIQQPGTKEYSEMGKLITSYPTFDYTVLNKSYPKKGLYIEVTGKNISEISAYSAFYTYNDKKIALFGEREATLIRFLIPSAMTKSNINLVSVWLTTKTKMNNHTIIEKKVAVN